MAIQTKEIKDFDLLSQVQGDDFLILQTASGETRKTTKDLILSNYISNAGGIISGGLQIDGDLTVTGTTTTVNSVEVTIEDPIVTLNYGVGTNTTSGLEVEKTGTNTQLIWNETTGFWELGEVGNTKKILTETDIDVQNTSISTSNSVDTLDTFDKNSKAGVKWLVVVEDGTNYRISEIISVWNSTNDNLTFSETSSTDIGDTSDILFAVDINGNDVRLLVGISNGSWNFNIQRILI